MTAGAGRCGVYYCTPDDDDDDDDDDEYGQQYSQTTRLHVLMMMNSFIIGHSQECQQEHRARDNRETKPHDDVSLIVIGYTLCPRV